jgi:hypothetical protein
MTGMQRCAVARADLVLDGRGWRFTSLRDAVATYRKLYSYRGTRWPDWPTTLRRLHAAAPFDEQQWFARLPQRQQPGGQGQTDAAVPTPRQEECFERQLPEDTL